MKPMLAKTYDGRDVTGWLMSEKLDGVRAIWTGSELISRAGNKFIAPRWFTHRLPAGAMLDGELYIGRGMFQLTVGIVRKKVPIEAEWQRISYRVFEAPQAAGGIEDHLAYCSEALKGCKVAEVVEHVPCRSMAHFEKFYNNLCDAGAEGIMLRKPGSDYEHRRSGNLLKVKPCISDEAVVIEYQEGQGKYVGMGGASGFWDIVWMQIHSRTISSSSWPRYPAGRRETPGVRSRTSARTRPALAGLLCIDRSGGLQFGASSRRKRTSTTGLL